MSERKTAIRQNSEGVYEVIDITSGEVIRTEKSLKGIDASSMDLEPQSNRLPAIYKFSQGMGQLICQKLMEGFTLSKISKMKGYPPIDVINHWIQTEENFKKAMRRARQARAEHFHDEVIDLGREAKHADKDEVQGFRIAADVLRWGAKVNDPETYGDRTKVSGELDVLTSVIVDTGIKRKPVIIPTEVKEKDGSKKS